MKRKHIQIVMLLLTVCFLILGAMFMGAAQNHKGVNVITGAYADGQYSTISSGNIGANSEKYEALNTNGVTFLALSGVTGIVFLVATISKKRK